MTAATAIPGLPDRIKRFRRDLGLDQVELAAEVGVDRTRISHWETGFYTPSLDAASRLAEALGVTLDRLVRGR